MIASERAQISGLEDFPDRLRIFLAWFCRHGGELHEDVTLSYDPISAGIHLVVKSDVARKIPKGTKVVSCPYGISMSGLNALDIFPAMGSPRTEADDTARLLTQDLMKEAPRPNCLTALWLCVHKVLGEKSWWKEYISCLPDLPEEYRQQVERDFKPGIGEIDTPIWWEQDETLLSDTLLDDPANKMKRAWKEEWEECKRLVRDLKATLGFEISWPIYKWAMSIIHSRGFRSSTLNLVTIQNSPKEDPKPVLGIYDPEILLLPMFDMMNHSSTTRNSHLREADKYSLVCNDEPGPGEEVFNSYGFKSNAQLLLSYGFSLKGNIHDYISIQRTPYTCNQELHTAFREQSALCARFFPSSDEASSTGLAKAPKHSSKPISEPGMEDRHNSNESSAPAFDHATLTYPIRYPECANLVTSCGRYPTEKPWANHFPTGLHSHLSIELANTREARVLKAWTDGTCPDALAKLGPNEALLCGILGLRSELVVGYMLLRKLERDYNLLRARWFDAKKRNPLLASGDTAKAWARLEKVDIMTSGHALIYKSALQGIKSASRQAMASKRALAQEDLIFLLPLEAQAELKIGIKLTLELLSDSEMDPAMLQETIWALMIAFTDQVIRDDDVWNASEVSDDAKKTQWEHLRHALRLWRLEYDCDGTESSSEPDAQEAILQSILRDLMDSVSDRKRVSPWRKLVKDPRSLKWALTVAEEETVLLRVPARKREKDDGSFHGNDEHTGEPNREYEHDDYQDIQTEAAEDDQGNKTAPATSAVSRLSNIGSYMAALHAEIKKTKDQPLGNAPVIPPYQPLDLMEDAEDGVDMLMLVVDPEMACMSNSGADYKG